MRGLSGSVLIAVVAGAAMLTACSAPRPAPALRQMTHVTCTPGPWITFFDEGSVAITATPRSGLAGVLAYFENPCIPPRITALFIVGHADLGENPELAMQRAVAVKTYLESHGVEVGGIELTSEGSSKPRVAPVPGIPEPQNRRVEIQAGPVLR